MVRVGPGHRRREHHGRRRVLPGPGVPEMDLHLQPREPRHHGDLPELGFRRGPQPDQGRHGGLCRHGQPADRGAAEGGRPGAGAHADRRRGRGGEPARHQGRPAEAQQGRARRHLPGEDQDVERQGCEGPEPGAQAACPQDYGGAPRGFFRYLVHLHELPQQDLR